jgi:DNA polymerase-3 subunit delta
VILIQNIWKKLNNSQFSSVYLLLGTEEWMIAETKQLIVKRALSAEEVDFNLSSFDLEETPIEIAVEDAETFPFMGERRVVFIHNPIFLTGDKGKGKIVHQVNRLEAYLSAPSETSIVVIVAPYEKLDERKKITKKLKSVAEVIEAKKMNEREIKGWLRERALMNQVQIEERALDRLIELSGTNLMMLMNEMDKLSLSLKDTKMIDVELVEALTARSLEQNVFTLVEVVAQKNVKKALQLYYDLLKQNEEPIKIVALLAAQFRLMYQVKELARKGYGQQQIATQLKTHPFRVKLAIGKASSFSEEELSNLIAKLAEADWQLKTSQFPKDMVLEMVLLKLAKATYQGD